MICPQKASLTKGTKIENLIYRLSLVDKPLSEPGFQAYQRIERIVLG